MTLDTKTELFLHQSEKGKSHVKYWRGRGEIEPRSLGSIMCISEFRESPLEAGSQWIENSAT